MIPAKYYCIFFAVVQSYFMPGPHRQMSRFRTGSPEAFESGQTYESGGNGRSPHRYLANLNADEMQVSDRL
jgi:hypothetical protein